jgi:hypothetical protein
LTVESFGSPDAVDGRNTLPDNSDTRAFADRLALAALLR